MFYFEHQMALLLFVIAQKVTNTLWGTGKARPYYGMLAKSANCALRKLASLKQFFA